MEDVHTVDLYLHLVALHREEIDVRLAEHDEEVALAGVLQIIGHMQVGVHARLEHGDTAECGELRGMGIGVEGASHEPVEVGVARLARGGQPFKQPMARANYFSRMTQADLDALVAYLRTLPPLE